MEPIEFQESDGTVRKLVWDSGDESVGVAPKWFADDNKWEERDESDYDDLLRDYQLVKERVEKAERELRASEGKWNLRGKQLIAIAEGRETVPLDGGTPDVFVAVQKLFQCKHGFQHRAQEAEAELGLASGTTVQNQLHKRIEELEARNAEYADDIKRFEKECAQWKELEAEVTRLQEIKGIEFNKYWKAAIRDATETSLRWAANDIQRNGYPRLPADWEKWIADSLAALLGEGK